MFAEPTPEEIVMRIKSDDFLRDTCYVSFDEDTAYITDTWIPQRGLTGTFVRKILNLFSDCSTYVDIHDVCIEIAIYHVNMECVEE